MQGNAPPPVHFKQSACPSPLLTQVFLLVVVGTCPVSVMFFSNDNTKHSTLLVNKNSKVFFSKWPCTALHRCVWVWLCVYICEFLLLLFLLLLFFPYFASQKNMQCQYHSPPPPPRRGKKSMGSNSVKRQGSILIPMPEQCYAFAK